MISLLIICFAIGMVLMLEDILRGHCWIILNGVLDTWTDTVFFMLTSKMV